MRAMKEHLELITTKQGLQRLAGITLIAIFATGVMLAMQALI
jgi:hypothetical protein